MYEEKPKNPTRSVATENAVGIGAGAQIRRLLHKSSHLVGFVVTVLCTATENCVGESLKEAEK